MQMWADLAADMVTLFGEISKSFAIQANTYMPMNISAFNNSNIMVPSNNLASGKAVFPAGWSWFNDVINVPRSSVEKMVGTWKARFPWLHNI